MEDSFEFDMAAGVRQGCVLSPRFFFPVLEWALSKWQAQCHGVGYGEVSLLDVRVAAKSTIRTFASSTSNSASSCALLWALLAAEFGLRNGTTFFTSRMHACYNVLNKLPSNYGPRDAWNNIGN